MRLGILSPSTCVGLRYGHQFVSLEVFLDSMESPTLWSEDLDITPQVNGTADLPTVPPYTLEPPLPIGGWAILLCHPIVQRHSGGTGILTCHPSTTPFGLALGAD